MTRTVDTLQFVTDMTDKPCRRTHVTSGGWLATLGDIQAGLVPERRTASEFDVEPLDSCETWALIESRFPLVETASGAVFASGLAESFERDLEEIWAL